MTYQENDNRAPPPVGVILSEEALCQVSGGERQIIQDGATYCETDSQAGPELEKD